MYPVYEEKAKITRKSNKTLRIPFSTRTQLVACCMTNNTAVLFLQSGEINKIHLSRLHPDAVLLRHDGWPQVGCCFLNIFKVLFHT